MKTLKITVSDGTANALHALARVSGASFDKTCSSFLTGAEQYIEAGVDLIEEALNLAPDGEPASEVVGRFRAYCEESGLKFKEAALQREVEEWEKANAIEA